MTDSYLDGFLQLLEPGSRIIITSSNGILPKKAFDVLDVDVDEMILELNPVEEIEIDNLEFKGKEEILAALGDQQPQIIKEIEQIPEVSTGQLIVEEAVEAGEDVQFEKIRESEILYSSEEQLNDMLYGQIKKDSSESESIKLFQRMQSLLYSIPINWSQQLNASEENVLPQTGYGVLNNYFKKGLSLTNIVPVSIETPRLYSTLENANQVWEELYRKQGGTGETPALPPQPFLNSEEDIQNEAGLALGLSQSDNRREIDVRIERSKYYDILYNGGTFNIRNEGEVISKTIEAPRRRYIYDIREDAEMFKSISKNYNVIFSKPPINLINPVRKDFLQPQLRILDNGRERPVDVTTERLIRSVRVSGGGRIKTCTGTNAQGDAMYYGNNPNDPFNKVIVRPPKYEIDTPGEIIQIDGFYFPSNHHNKNLLHSEIQEEPFLHNLYQINKIFPWYLNIDPIKPTKKEVESDDLFSAINQAFPELRKQLGDIAKTSTSFNKLRERLAFYDLWFDDISASDFEFARKELIISATKRKENIDIEDLKLIQLFKNLKTIKAIQSQLDLIRIKIPFSQRRKTIEESFTAYFKSLKQRELTFIYNVLSNKQRKRVRVKDLLNLLNNLSTISVQSNFYIMQRIENYKGKIDKETYDIVENLLKAENKLLIQSNKQLLLRLLLNLRIIAGALEKREENETETAAYIRFKLENPTEEEIPNDLEEKYSVDDKYINSLEGNLKRLRETYERARTEYSDLHKKCMGYRIIKTFYSLDDINTNNEGPSYIDSQYDTSNKDLNILASIEKQEGLGEEEIEDRMKVFINALRQEYPLDSLFEIEQKAKHALEIENGNREMGPRPVEDSEYALLILGEHKYLYRRVRGIWFVQRKTDLTGKESACMAELKPLHQLKFDDLLKPSSCIPLKGVCLPNYLQQYISYIQNLNSTLNRLKSIFKKDDKNNSLVQAQKDIKTIRYLLSLEKTKEIIDESKLPLRTKLTKKELELYRIETIDDIDTKLSVLKIWIERYGIKGDNYILDKRNPEKKWMCMHRFRETEMAWKSNHERELILDNIVREFKGGEDGENIICKVCGETLRKLDYGDFEGMGVEGNIRPREEVLEIDQPNVIELDLSENEKLQLSFVKLLLNRLGLNFKENEIAKVVISYHSSNLNNNTNEEYVSFLQRLLKDDVGDNITDLMANQAKNKFSKFFKQLNAFVQKAIQVVPTLDIEELNQWANRSNSDKLKKQLLAGIKLLDKIKELWNSQKILNYLIGSIIIVIHITRTTVPPVYLSVADSLKARGGSLSFSGDWWNNKNGAIEFIIGIIYGIRDLNKSAEPFKHLPGNKNTSRELITRGLQLLESTPLGLEQIRKRIIYQPSEVKIPEWNEFKPSLRSIRVDISDLENLEIPLRLIEERGITRELLQTITQNLLNRANHLIYSFDEYLRNKIGDVSVKRLRGFALPNEPFNSSIRTLEVPAYRSFLQSVKIVRSIIKQKLNKQSLLIGRGGRGYNVRYLLSYMKRPSLESELGIQRMKSELILSRRKIVWQEGLLKGRYRQIVNINLPLGAFKHQAQQKYTGDEDFFNKYLIDILATEETNQELLEDYVSRLIKDYEIYGDNVEIDLTTGQFRHEFEGNIDDLSQEQIIEELQENIEKTYVNRLSDLYNPIKPIRNLDIFEKMEEIHSIFKLPTEEMKQIYSSNIAQDTLELSSIDNRNNELLNDYFESILSIIRSIYPDKTSESLFNKLFINRDKLSELRQLEKILVQISLEDTTVLPQREYREISTNYGMILKEVLNTFQFLIVRLIQIRRQKNINLPKSLLGGISVKSIFRNWDIKVPESFSNILEEYNLPEILNTIKKMIFNIRRMDLNGNIIYNGPKLADISLIILGYMFKLMKDVSSKLNTISNQLPEEESIRISLIFKQVLEDIRKELESSNRYINLTNQNILDYVKDAAQRRGDSYKRSFDTLTDDEKYAQRLYRQFGLGKQFTLGEDPSEQIEQDYLQASVEGGLAPEYVQVQPENQATYDAFNEYNEQQRIEQEIQMEIDNEMVIGEEDIDGMNED